MVRSASAELAENPCRYQGRQAAGRIPIVRRKMPYAKALSSAHVGAYASKWKRREPVLCRFNPSLIPIHKNAVKRTPNAEKKCVCSVLVSPFRTKALAGRTWIARRQAGFVSERKSVLARRHAPLIRMQLKKNKESAKLPLGFPRRGPVEGRALYSKKQGLTKA